MSSSAIVTAAVREGRASPQFRYHHLLLGDIPARVKYSAFRLMGRRGSFLWFILTIGSIQFLARPYLQIIHSKIVRLMA